MVCCPKHSSITKHSQKTGKALKTPHCASNKTGRRVKSLSPSKCKGRAAGIRSGKCCPKGATFTMHNPKTGHKYAKPVCIKLGKGKNFGKKAKLVKCKGPKSDYVQTSRMRTLSGLGSCGCAG